MTIKSEIIRVEDRLPDPAVRVIVVSKKFRCLGYIDRDGVWRDDAKNAPLADIVGWMEV